MAKENPEVLLTQISANYSVDPSTLIHVSDLLRAVIFVVTSSPEVQRKPLMNRLSRLPGSVALICRYLGEDKNPDNTLVHEIIRIKDGFDEWLKDRSPTTMRPIHIAGLRLLLTFARSIGFVHQAFAIENAWEKLTFTAVDHGAKRAIDALKLGKVYPHEVTDEHLEQWQQETLTRGIGPGHVKRSVSQLKYRIRQAGLEAQFPNLNFVPTRPEQYRVAMKDMHPGAAKELENMVQWLAEQDEADLIRMGKVSRLAFVRYVESLYGYAFRFHRVHNIRNLRQLFTRGVITDFGRWMYLERSWKSHSISVLLRGIRSVLKVHPSYSTKNWNWILDFVKEFPEEPESTVEHRRQKRAFNYDYATLSTIPKNIRELRSTAKGLSETEKGWMIHDELLMLWLLTYPWPPRCLRECRIVGDHANLIAGCPRPHLHPNRSSDQR